MPNCCNKKTAHIYNASQQKTKGWWCKQCNKFYPAIGREKKLTPNNKVTKEHDHEN